MKVLAHPLENIAVPILRDPALDLCQGEVDDVVVVYLRWVVGPFAIKPFDLGGRLSSRRWLPFLGPRMPFFWS